MRDASYLAQATWERGDQPFLDNRYSRAHVLQFDGGARVAASSSPHVVRTPFSDASAVDPEELFVASLASCHLLWFLSIAADRRFCVDRYVDDAIGTMRRGIDGRLAMSDVVLRPLVQFSGPSQPATAEVIAMHERAHDECFIANSVRCAVRCEPRFP